MTVDTCKACEHSGLPILFVYHGAIANDASFGPAAGPAQSNTPSGASVSPAMTGDVPGFKKPQLVAHVESVRALGLPTLNHARYVLRSLRPGTYLYIFHEKPSTQLKREAAAAKAKDPHWEVLRMMEGGALVPQGDPRFTMPAPFACQRDFGSHVFTTLTYRLRDAHEEGAIFVGVSANLWDEKLRAQNKPLLQRVDIKAVLAGKSPSDIIHPTDGQWFNTHIADFALGEMKHGGFVGSSPLAKVKDAGDSMHKRMLALSAGHTLTKGKGFVMPLRDSVGTAEALKDLARARAQQASAYAYSQRHPLGAMAGIDFINRHVSDEHLRKVKAEPLNRSHLYDSKGDPLFSPEVKDQVPPEMEWSKWGYLGSMSKVEFLSHQGSIEHGVPKDTVFLLRRDPRPYRSGRAASHVQRGILIAPSARVAEVTAYHASAKIRRIHHADHVQKFDAEFRKKVEYFNQRIKEHNQDRSKVLALPVLCQCFAKQFDPNDPNAPGKLHVPGVVYMEEVSKALLGEGVGIHGMEEIVWKLLNADPEKSEEAWALRGMVGNQKSLFAPLQGFLANQINWYTGQDDSKLDKTYDTLKALLGDSATADHLLNPKFAWLNKAGIGLSFGLMGFVSGAAIHFSGRKLEDAVGANAVNEAQAKAKTAAKGVQSAITSASENALKLMDTAEDRLAKKINAWCEVQYTLLRSILYKQPPDVPMRVRAEITGAEFLIVLGRLEEAGADINRTTRALADRLRSLRPNVPELGELVQFDFVTSRNTMTSVRNAHDLAKSAGGIRVRVLSDKTTPILMATPQVLADLYRRAHRYDGIKESMPWMLNMQVPAAVVGTANLAMAPARTAATVGVSAGSGGVLGKTAAASVRTATDTGAHLSVFGAWLQWRMFQDNQVKLERLSARLETHKGKLSPEQRATLEDAIDSAILGVADNYAGMAGGALEVGAILFEKLRLVYLPAGFAAFAAFAGAAGNFANAAQNFLKAKAKQNDGDQLFSYLYRGVGFSYALGAVGFFAGGVEIGATAVSKKLLVKASLRGATAIARRQALVEGGELVAMRLLGLSLGGWGLVFTVVAFAVEGIVIYMDRTPLEAWLESSYFGNDPQFRGKGGKENKPQNWDRELAALQAAIKKASDDLLTDGGSTIEPDYDASAVWMYG